MQIPEKNSKFILALGGLLVVLLLLCTSETMAQERWKAPPEADELENPYSLNDEEVFANGQDFYEMLCASCHGSAGDGGGGAGQTFNPPPADFTTETVQKQSDGALFWKVWEGNPPAMIPYKQLLSEDEVWQIVIYLRQYRKD